MNKTERMSAAQYRKMIAKESENKANVATVQRNAQSSDRGRSFENLLLNGCKYYQAKGVAVINKVYEPYICTRILPEGKFIGRFLGKAEPDYKGVLADGTAIAFEAKSTSKSRIQRNALTPEQFDWLREQSKMGAVTFVAVDIQGRFFNIPFEKWDSMKKYYGKKFLCPGDIDEYEVMFDGSAVRFLEYEKDVFVELGGRVKRDKKLRVFCERLINWLYESEKELFELCPDCCVPDSVDALEAECNELRYEFKKILEGEV